MHCQVLDHPALLVAVKLKNEMQKIIETLHFANCNHMTVTTQKTIAIWQQKVSIPKDSITKYCVYPCVHA